MWVIRILLQPSSGSARIAKKSRSRRPITPVRTFLAPVRVLYMHGDDGGLTPCFVVVSKSLDALRDCLTDAGTTAPTQALSQLVQLRFQNRSEPNNKGHWLIRVWRS